MKFCKKQEIFFCMYGCVGILNCHKAFVDLIHCFWHLM